MSASSALPPPSSIESSLPPSSPPRWRAVPRFDGIDALRGFAAVYVVLYHLVLVPADHPTSPEWARFFIHNGGSGVTLFFVISAFTLCLSVDARAREPQPRLSFYLRRFFRIAPLFYVWLFVHVALRFFQGGSFSWKEIAINGTFLFNFSPRKYEGIVWASWTLGVEMMFYAIFPFAFRAARTIPRAILLWSFTIGLSLLWTLWFGRQGFGHFGLAHHLPSFAVGILAYRVWIAWIRDRSVSVFWGRGLFLGGAAILGTVFLSNFSLPLDPLFPISIGYACMLLGLLIEPMPIFVNRATCFVGEISYSVYLNHVAFLFALNPLYGWVRRQGWSLELALISTFGVTLGAVLLYSLLTYKLVEQPGQQWGRQVLKRWRGELKTGPQHCQKLANLERTTET